ncbi:adenine phosphoribosyltransferase [Jatrophihabitans telluris]|uniref:Adenine phosphoribosyltransferase n=1 Tax=Jatrophihabitans telluris TaxID=2038343 RepID=A0ABY4QV05_9ACTN|nr:adenine phosphoribosyltransferase [Jatrophihabitans telluris]UQX86799.1 adenine phosphoribosyltransferase [Jatrophihabitans telluris]
MTAAADGRGLGGEELAQLIDSMLRDVPDFPLPGVLFKDIAPLLADAAAFNACIDAFADLPAAFEADLIAGVEARGFVVAAAVARAVDAGVVPVRKAGKLPPPTVSARYELEYGSAEIEVPVGLLEGKRVYLVDDVLATGGTLAATIELLTRAGATITGVGVLVELSFLNGRQRLEGQDLTSLLVL